MVQSAIERHTDRAREERRRRYHAYLFVVPLIALGMAASEIHLVALALPVAAAVLCYLQARFLKMSSAGWWAIAGLFLNLFAMVYLLGYAHGRGLPERDPSPADNPGVGADGNG